MPNFAAFAAHRAADEAALRMRPEDLTELARHLRALGPTAPPALHLAIVDAMADIEDAVEEVAAADALTGLARVRASNAAHDQVREAVSQARTVILTVEPTARRMRGTDLPVTADSIRAAAHAYLAVDGDPQEHAAIDTGTPTVQVHSRGTGGLGWEVLVTITAGVRADIGHIPAHAPIVLRIRRRDGRLSATETARRLLSRKTTKLSYLRVDDVPVEFLPNSRA
jgi:hypothetical protein